MPRSLFVVASWGLLPCVMAAQDVKQLRGDACHRGELLSCNVLGLMYETGAGGVPDQVRAADLY
jgi:TPR repeat protein